MTIQQLVHLLHKEVARPSLAQLIGQSKNLIIDQFVKEACAKIPNVKNHDKSIIRDDLPHLLASISNALAVDDPTSQIQPLVEDIVGHAWQRSEQEDYSLSQVICEFQVLRDILLIMAQKSDYEGLKSEELIRKIFDCIISASAQFFMDFCEGQVKKSAAETYQSKLALEETVVRLQKEQLVRDRFVDTLTHDLRNPLSAVKMSAEIISMLQGQSPAEILNCAEKILRNVNRADRMIKDLLDANFLRAGEKLPLHCAPCDLSKLVRDVLADLESLGSVKCLAEIPPSLPGVWDEEGLRRLLENLCNNAIKYGDANRPKTVHLSDENSHVRLQVHNWGAVIPEEEQGSLFEPFKRSESAKKSNAQGWGIGLSIVRGIVEAHGGIVSMESTEAAGTTFTVILPKYPKAS